MSMIAVVGTGYVGLVTGACFADLGNDVICIDIDERKIAALQAGSIPIYEPGLEEMVVRNARAGRLRFTTSYAAGLPSAEFCFITVDTPSGSNGQANMTAVRGAAQMIGQAMRGHTTIINKSTMPIGSGDLVTSIVAPFASDDVTFDVVSNPEFLREGAAIQDFMSPDRVVLGSTNPAAAEHVAELYAPLNAPVLMTDLRTAEMIKYAANAFLATRISFINEVAQICERLHADVRVVAEGMGLDKRIGRHFLDAGIGFGGSCFPKDVRALAYMAEATDCHPQLLNAVVEINEAMRRRFVLKVERILGDLHGATIGAWGLAFKPDTDDMREAPAIDILKGLVQKGARVRAYDPVSMDNARRYLPEIEYSRSPYDAAADADAVILLTHWNEFKQVDLTRVARQMRRPIMVDGRNLYDPAEVRRHGFVYAGVGRC
ncbi:MAG: UDP-glucose/GDP-mannose dehydrogenase family protein [Chloroflexi bacterium]|nr:UDP-glucose/GDP-mannose dehydrogenase family protein [Chloroflexota bacterium]